jgi:PAS domain S-box-containing protein
MILSYLRGLARVALAGLSIAAIALIDSRVDPPISFGFLYLFPILLVGTVWPRWAILLMAVVCTVLADVFDPFPFGWAVSMPQDILVFTSLGGTGLFAYEVNRRRERELENLRRVEREAMARREAEEQLEFLIDSSPVAILTMTGDCLISRANLAAHRLFGVPAGELPGRSIRRYVPALGRVPFLGETPQAFRTEMQCRGEREKGDVFLANVFFSTYQTAVGPRLAALVVDASEELRDREEASLEQVMAGSRILVGAVSHEIRNVCGAIGVIYENLGRDGVLKTNKDFEALGSLIETLSHIAAWELKQTATNGQVGGLDLSEVLDDLRIVLEPYCQEADIELHWQIPADLPSVWAERHSLMQVLLNLTKNSERALRDSPQKRIDIAVTAKPRSVIIRVTDSGPGIQSTEKLFQPFQKGAASTGLGLYLSRAFMRSFHGDLRHDPAVPGCSFVIELAVAGPDETDYGHAGNHGTHTPITTR